MPKSSARPAPATPATDQFLVCGLGSVGQHCVAILKDFGVIVHAIDQDCQQDWEIPQLPHLLDSWIMGDCRHAETLEQGQVRECRAVLLVTADDRVNIEAGLVARSLNPQVRLVVRSSKGNLSRLLEQQLGNYVAFEPTQLSAPAFAFAALNSATTGFFAIGDHWFEVIQHELGSRHPWLRRSRLHSLNNQHRRILTWLPSPSSPARLSSPSPRSPLNRWVSFFHHWDPLASLTLGDRITTLEWVRREDRNSRWNPAGQPLDPASLEHSPPFTSPLHTALDLDADDGEEDTASPLAKRSRWRTWNRRLRHTIQSGTRWFTLWLRSYRRTYKGQLLHVFVLCGIAVFALLLGGTLLFWIFYPNMGLVTAFYTTMVLLLGGYGDLFGAVEIAQTIPWGLRLFSLGLTLAGTAFVGVLYALITERLLTLRFQFFKRRLPIPKKDHVIIVGLGRVSHHVGLLLKNFQQAVVIVTPTPDPNLRSQLPIVEGELSQVMDEVNLSTAKSVVAVTEAEMDNLEVALMTRAANPKIDLIIRTYHRRFRDTVARLFPYTQVLCASELSAEAFAAAAFGENVVSLFRLHFQTILVTDYHIEAEDTLNGMLLAEIAYGYGVVPIFHQRLGEGQPLPMPSDDVRLQVGDRLVVLATIQALKQIEQGVMAPRNWQVRVEQARTREAAMAGALTIARITGCIPVIAQTLMDHLPGLVPIPLYQHQALRLVRKLQQVKVRARAIEVVTAPIH